MPHLIASRRARWNCRSVENNLAAHDAIDSEQRIAKLGSPGPDQSRDAKHFAAMQIEAHIPQFRGREIPHGQIISPAAARRPLMRFQFPPPIMAMIWSMLVSPARFVPITAPSRITVIRSAIRRISFILCDT